MILLKVYGEFIIEEDNVAETTLIRDINQYG